MRTYTEKEKKALTVSLRTFIRDMSGRRMEEKRAAAALSSALDGGLPLDMLFNPQNFLRLKATIDEPTVEDYVEAMLEDGIETRRITEEPAWESNGLAVVAHVYHDFYCCFDPKGGVWSTPTAMSNLARLIGSSSLAPILSERLLSEVSETGKMTVYTYVTSLLSGGHVLEAEPTQEEADRAARLMETASAADGNAADTIDEHGQDPEEHAGESQAAVDRFLRRLTDGTAEESDDLYPDPEAEAEPETGEEETPEEGEDDVIYDDAFDGYDPSVSYSVRPNPYLVKRDAVESALAELTLAEIDGLATTMEEGRFLKLTEIIDNLTAGRFDTSLEGVEVKQTHMLLCSMLVQRFIDCCRMNGVEMDEDKASCYDVLKAEWDLRNPRVRTFHKLRELILQKGGGDADLNAAIGELEKYYAEE